MLTPGANIPEPSTLFLMLAGTLSVLLPKIVGALRSLAQKPATLRETQVS
jgi:hypothetical protein